jgi:hypothetical protein
MEPWLKNILGDRDPLDVRVEEMELSVRPLNCFHDEGIRTLRDLVTKSESDLLRIPNFGRKSLHEIKEMLGEFGLELRKTTSLSIEEEMTHAMARVRAAKVAYAEAVLDVQRVAKRMVDEDLEDTLKVGE